MTHIAGKANSNDRKFGQSFHGKHKIKGTQTKEEFRAVLAS